MSSTVLTSQADRGDARRRQIHGIAEASLARRHTYSKLFLVLCWVALALAIVPIVAVISYTLIKGIAAWTPDFFTQVTKPEGIPNGGVWNAIVGTAVIGTIATVVTVPLGLLIGLALAQSDGRLAGVVRFAADVMTGIPSILIGIFGYVALVTKYGYSGLIGAFAIGMIMLPIMIRAGETAIRGVPSSLHEAGVALGARRFIITRRIIIPEAMPGIITGGLLAVARGIGETAPLLFTIFGTQFFQLNPTKPMNALPLVIYNNSSQPYADLVRVAWGAALLLMVAVLVLSIGSRLLAGYLQREKR